MENFISANYFWISIEGTDAIGKTKLLKEIEKYLKKTNKGRFCNYKGIFRFSFW